VRQYVNGLRDYW